MNAPRANRDRHRIIANLVFPIIFQSTTLQRCADIAIFRPVPSWALCCGYSFFVDAADINGRKIMNLKQHWTEAGDVKLVAEGWDVPKR